MDVLPQSVGKPNTLYVTTSPRLLLMFVSVSFKEHRDIEASWREPCNVLLKNFDMKIHLSIAGKSDSEQTIDMSGWKSGINVLVLIHTFFFLVFTVIQWAGWLDAPLSDGTIRDFVKEFFVFSRDSKYGPIDWMSAIVVYQFVHVSVVEFLLSMSVLWIFGHILRVLVGEGKVIVLYLVAVIFSGISFVLSHYIFEIFSGHSTIMEGAFAGALGVMTATVVIFRSYHVRFFGTISLALWQIYAAVLLISVALLFKPSMACILAYLSSIWLGCRYAINLTDKSQVTERS